MLLPPSLGLWILIADWLIRIAALLWIPSRTRPAAARSWLLLIGFVPLLGQPAYLLLGHPWLSTQRRQRQQQASALIREGQRSLAVLRWTPPTALPDIADIARLAERLGDFMPMTGNRIALLDVYDASLQQLLGDIDAATHEVHLLYYLMYDDAVGASVVDALTRAAQRGVRCRVLLDAVGAKRGLRAYARPLRHAGVTVQATLANGGLAWRRSARLDLRNHRKIAVVDGRIAHVGSQNLAEAAFIRGRPNREVVARIEGPVVTQLQALFASDWYIETGDVLAVTPSPAVAGGSAVAQLLPSGPAYPFENARDVLVALVQRARRSAVLVTPYFVPDDATLSALRIAALSGVEVQLVLSQRNNQRLTAWAQAAFYDELLAAGVRIALYRPHFLHAKHLRIDDDIALVGSCNLDIRSFLLNAEAGLICYDRDVVTRLRAIEDAYLADADVLDAATWHRRPQWRRSIEGIARLADSFL